LKPGETLDKINGVYVFSRESQTSDATTYWWYNSKTKSWAEFQPVVYHYPKDDNPLKTIFWDAVVAPISPIKDIDIYASASIKHKVEIPLAGGKSISSTLVWGGVQVGVTSKDNKGLYGNVVTGDNSYISYKLSDGLEVRGAPLRGLGVTIPISPNPQVKYGDFAPQIRVLKDIAPIWRVAKLQGEAFGGWHQDPGIGLRVKAETPTVLNGWSAEVAAGARVTLQLPQIISVFLKK